MISDREAVALEVMATDDLMALGEWKATLESLEKKGYVRHLTGLFYRRTPAGDEAFAAFEEAEMRAVMGAKKPVDEFEGVTIEGEAEDE